jgi:hypothetical protein
MLTETIWRMEMTTFVATVKGGIGETLEMVLRVMVVQSIALSYIMHLMVLITLTVTGVIERNAGELLLQVIRILEGIDYAWPPRGG